MLDVVYNHVCDTNPKFNEKLKKGLVKENLQEAPEIIDLLWAECVSSNFPDALNYERGSFSIATPEEMVRLRKTTDDKLEMLTTEYILAKYTLTWTNEDNETKDLPPVLIPIPFCNDYGITKIRGVPHLIHNVIADKVFSRVEKGLFVVFTRDRLTFERTQHTYTLNHKPRISFVTHSAIHAFRKKNKTKVGADTSLVMYLFAKYGLDGAFKKFLDLDVGKDIIFGTEEEISEKYGTDEYHICRSQRHKLSGYNDPLPIGDFDLTIAVTKKAFEKSKLVEDFIVGIFYAIEYYPSIIKLDRLLKSATWINVLGEIIYEDQLKNYRKISSTTRHIESLDTYVDELMKIRLQSVDCYSEDIYEFMIYILEQIDDLYVNLQPSSMFNKRIETRNYILLDTIKTINVFAYSIVNPNMKATEKHVRQKLSSRLPKTVIETEKHGEISVVSFAGDNVMFKYNTALVNQVEATGSGKSKKVLTDPASKFHPSIIGICSHLNQNKPNPMGTSKLNPFVIIDDNYSVDCAPHLQEELMKIVPYI